MFQMLFEGIGEIGVVIGECFGGVGKRLRYGCAVPRTLLLEFAAGPRDLGAGCNLGAEGIADASSFAAPSDEVCLWPCEDA
jgi:hypothetical protein